LTVVLQKRAVMYPIRMQYLATLVSVSTELVSYCLRSSLQTVPRRRKLCQ
jgi:hypothetical protein